MMLKAYLKTRLIILLTTVLLMSLLVPAANASVFDDPLLRLDSVTVNSTSGAPALYINNVKTPTIMFTQWGTAIPDTWITKYPNFAGDAKYAGIHLYQVRAIVGSTVAALQPLLDSIIAQDPEAYFDILIWTATPSELEITNYALNDPNIDPTAPYHVSLGSEKWRQNAGLKVRQLVRDINYSPYRDRVIGYMLTGGLSGEWMDPEIFGNTDFDRSLSNHVNFRNFLKTKYVTDAALRTAWNHPTVTLNTAWIPTKITNGPFIDPNIYQSTIDFMEYDSQNVAKSIEYLCSVVKDETNNKRICGVAYGYSMETAQFNNISGHLGFNYLLNSTLIDYFCQILSYDTRQVDGYSGWHGFADSARNHGKLIISEDDTRTHVSLDPEDDWIRFATNENESSAILWKNFMAALTKRFGHWWYDNSGSGNVNTPGLIHQVAMMNSLAEAANSVTQTNWTEVALIVDEKSMLYQTPAQSALNAKLQPFRRQMGKMGVPFDVISLDDLVAGYANNYRMYVFANSYALTSAQRTAINNLRNSDKAFVWIGMSGILDPSTKAASYTTLQDITWMDIRLASSSAPMGTTGNLTEVPLANFYSSFSNTNPPHAFAVAFPNETLVSSPDGKAIVVRQDKNTWFSFFADDITLLTPALLRGMLTDAGIHIYSHNDRVVNANNKFLAVTMPGGGTTEDIWFPINGTFYEVISDTEYTVTNNKLTMSASLPRTYVFYYGTRASLGMVRPVLPSSTVDHIDLTKGETANLQLYPTQTFKIDPDIMTAENFEVTEGKTITWSSDNASVATVNSSGVVTAVAVGTTTIRASNSGKTGTRTVNVVAANTIKSIRFTETGHSINKGSTYAPTLEVVYINGGAATLSSSSATWSSQNTNIATVNASGVITGVYDGAVAVTATYLGKTAAIGISINDTVTNIPRDIWFSNGGYKRFDSISGTYALNVKAVDKFVVETDVTSTSTYTSLNPAVATVSASGVITPVATGITVITAGKYNKVARILVEVNRVEMDPMTIGINTTMTVGQTQTPTVTAKPQFSSVTKSWSLSSGTSVQITGGGASLYGASTGQSKVKGNIGFNYPKYDITINVISSVPGQIRPIYTITVN
ncbi:Ig-like domain-containing protein [Paenibacillus sp. LHD-117]|uniref:Ig-like domain-containing protein n=1 Tax=Paenibacillus sp. LHD-117 TaxID=3071412 RepID=UPI0027DF5B20|nr:Ig-like domain-containing protein [Paenibacillus sp. LHD-117]MDQ6419711.1 Ig-like domain-containing protein [Paenibacillus sp. LHD-117]